MQFALFFVNGGKQTTRCVYLGKLDVPFRSNPPVSAVVPSASSEKGGRLLFNQAVSDLDLKFEFKLQKWSFHLKEKRWGGRWRMGVSDAGSDLGPLALNPTVVPVLRRARSAGPAETLFWALSVGY